MKLTFMLSIISMMAISTLFGQLQADSISVSAQFTTDSLYTDSTGTYQSLKVYVTVNDTSDVGRLIVDVLDNTGMYPLYNFQYDRQQLLSENMFSGNVIGVYAGFLKTGVTYQIKTIIQNAAYYNLPQIVTNYSGSN